MGFLCGACKLIYLNLNNSQFDNLRFSGGDQPDSSTALLLIIAIASADQLVAVMFKELLYAFLIEGLCSPSLHNVTPDCWRNPRVIEYRLSLRRREL
jgi:hypothetical protein